MNQRCGNYSGLILVAAAAALISGCLAQEKAAPPAGRVAISVAPLALQGLTNAEYTVTVRNGANGAGEVVWTRALDADRYGDGAGSLAYVGPCDADVAGGVNTVTLDLIALYGEGGVEIDPATYKNPTPLSRELACVANADVAVTFDMTIVRQAQQGFFDVAVSFKDIFCSAKLDCESAPGQDLELLHNPNTGARDMTAVVGFACTGSPTGSTYLYMDDLLITCAGGAATFAPIEIDPSGLGNLDTHGGLNVNDDGYLFAASVFRGVEGFAGKAYWNISLGLDDTRFSDAGTCILVGRATASAQPFPPDTVGFPLPADSVYPVIDWNVPLSSGTARLCQSHAVNAPGSGVATNYLGYLGAANQFVWGATPIRLDVEFEPGYADGPRTRRVAGATCAPACVHGDCTATNTCTCDAGWEDGANCLTPQCPAGCNGGSCTGPGVCACPPGAWGASCAGTCDAVAHCAVTPTCTVGTDSVCATCADGYLEHPDGRCVACLSAADCADDANVCTVKACTDGVCEQLAGNDGALCRAAAGACDRAEVCDGVAADCPADAFAPDTDVCRAAAGACDVAERCTGSTASCPADGFAPATDVCRAAAGACDVAERCTGSTASCPVDSFAPATDVCRAVAGDCDLSESCTGSGADCPADEFRSNADVCRLAAADCDLPDACSGTAAACPVDLRVDVGTPCRPAVDVCDVAESCDGSVSCPVNAFANAGTACGDPGDPACDNPDTCDGGGGCLPNFEPPSTLCRADAGACDVADFCTGAGACGADAREPDGTPCADASFCNGAESCVGGACADAAPACDPSAAVCDEAGDVCVAIYRSCAEASEAGEVTSGLYWLDPDGAGAAVVRQAYCDMTPGDAGWMLASKFVQTQTITLLPPETYDAYFGNTGASALWIKGASEGNPTSPVPDYIGQAYTVESVDWREHLTKDHRYELRQMFFKGAGDAPFDGRFRFTYNGVVSQNDTAETWRRAWQLLDRRVPTDGTGVAWDTDNAHNLFWLPFSNPVSGAVYTACGDYELSPSGCGLATESYRRYGSAGVMSPMADGDTKNAAGDWAPHTLGGAGAFDVVYAHGTSAIYGTSGAEMTLLYWIREETCGTDADCDSGLCQAGACIAYQSSCGTLRKAGQAASGLYTVDPDGVDGPGAPRQVYCDMVTDGGGWTLMTKMTQNGTFSTLSQGDYDAWFKDALWIKGSAQAVPTSPVPDYGGHKVESVDWREHLDVGAPYDLRQTLFKDAGAATFDVSFRFSYNGYVAQNDVLEYDWQGVWPLFDRTVLADDTTGISWDTDNPHDLFWLPFSAPGPYGAFTGCGDYEYSSSGCSRSTPELRRYGNAGVMSHSSDGDNLSAAASWAPHARADGAYDLVYVYSGEASYGTSAGDLGFLYWTREVTCDTHTDCDSGLCLGNGTCAGYQRSCAALGRQGLTTSGLYRIDPDGVAGRGKPRQVYCDMTTDGGGWQLMAKFSQHQTIRLLDPAVYDAYFGTNATHDLWIEGKAMAAPTSPVPSYDDYHLESVDWREYLTQGERYELRQHFFKGAGTATGDFAYRFTYNGNVKQDTTAPEWGRVWNLLDRQVLADTTGVDWGTIPASFRFWLPFTSAYTDSVYSGCGGWALEATACTATGVDARRYGNAGIIGPSAAGDGNDPAPSWAPLMAAYSGVNFDVAFVHQNGGVTYGTTGSPMVLMYWIREETCDVDADCDSGLCQGDGTCIAYKPTCASLYAAGQTADGTYTLDADGPLGVAVPAAVYCDMTVASTAPLLDGTTMALAGVSCEEINRHAPGQPSGTYWINPSGSNPVQAYCEMAIDGGGWTRLDGALATVDFVKEGVTVPAAWNGAQVEGTTIGAGCAGVEGVDPSQYRLGGVPFAYASVFATLTRTTTILQCSSIGGQYANGYFTPPYDGQYTPAGVCKWRDGLWSNATSTDMTGLVLNWVLRANGYNAELFYRTRCSAANDNGAFVMQWYVR